MSTYLSAYTISMSDTVELGREKINFLFTGDSTPFNIFSGTSENLGETSVYRNTNNFINETNSIYSSSSSFNLILNGTGNTIDTTSSIDIHDGSFNLVSGINNKIIGTGNTNFILGSGNTNISNKESFILGSNNENNSNNIIISSSNIINSDSGNNFFITSNNSSTSGGNGNNLFISGKNNKFITDSLSDLSFSFIGNGMNNIIKSNSGFSSSQNGIINGQNNNISNANNVILFGSNLASLDINNYSHFENIKVDESIYAKKYKSYSVAGNSTSSTAITLDNTFSFHRININFFPSLSNDEIAIKLPTPLLPNQSSFLSLVISDNFGITPGTIIYFVDVLSTSPFSDRTTTTPSQISSKAGNSSIPGGNRMITNLSTNETVAYFFVWISIINKWVMFTSNVGYNATF